MHQHVLGMRRPVRAVPPIRLGIVVILALVALAVPAPAKAASDAADATASRPPGGVLPSAPASEAPVARHCHPSRTSSR